MANEERRVTHPSITGTVSAPPDYTGEEERNTERKKPDVVSEGPRTTHKDIIGSVSAPPQTGETPKEVREKFASAVGELGAFSRRTAPPPITGDERVKGWNERGAWMRSTRAWLLITAGIEANIPIRVIAKELTRELGTQVNPNMVTSQVFSYFGQIKKIRPEVFSMLPGVLKERNLPLPTGEEIAQARAAVEEFKKTIQSQLHSSRTRSFSRRIPMESRTTLPKKEKAPDKKGTLSDRLAVRYPFPNRGQKPSRPRLEPVPKPIEEGMVVGDRRWDRNPLALFIVEEGIKQGPLFASIGKLLEKDFLSEKNLPFTASHFAQTLRMGIDEFNVVSRRKLLESWRKNRTATLRQETEARNLARDIVAKRIEYIRKQDVAAVLYPQPEE